MPSKIITEELKQDIIKYYQSQPMTLKQVADKYGLSNPTVGKILKDVPKYTKSKIKNPNLKEDFFQNIDCEEKAYFLGLLIADGNVFIPSDGGRQASISITLDLNDEYMLQKFKDIVNSNTSIGHDGRGCGQIAVRSNIMAKDLAKYGVVPRKSEYTYLPEIEDKYMSHLIRGILDGDGSIQAKLNKNNKFLHSISFCGTHQLMQDISDYCFNKLSLKKKPTIYDYKDRKLSETKIQNINDMTKFGNWIYRDANIFLIRKKNIYLDFINHYNITFYE